MGWMEEQTLDTEVLTLSVPTSHSNSLNQWACWFAFLGWTEVWRFRQAIWTKVGLSNLVNLFIQFARLLVKVHCKDLHSKKLDGNSRWPFIDCLRYALRFMLYNSCVPIAFALRSGYVTHWWLFAVIEKSSLLTKDQVVTINQTYTTL